MERFYAHGKLLIAGEYAVLDGALAWAIPTRFGQSLTVQYTNETSCPTLLWEAFLSDGNLWFSVKFDLRTFEILAFSDETLAQSLQQIFQQITTLNPNFFSSINQNIACKTQLEFPKDWGLGSSSTLIALLAQWTKVDAFALNDLTFQTSGYDVACATHDQPILYQLIEEDRRIEEVEFSPPFLDELFFVYLNQKQDTQAHVTTHYKNLERSVDWLNGFSALTYNLLHATTLEEFETLMNLHESLVVSRLNFQKVKDLYFSDYGGSVKSLGAWGGDFVLLTARPDFRNYLKDKGFEVVFSWKDLIL
ncbi:MAG TPA: GYDIA family GHMP kinase [Moheibacter sp.]|nr:GYDIA family GHMP kinase [Moheibacter sp.]